MSNIEQELLTDELMMLKLGEIFSFRIISKCTTYPTKQRYSRQEPVPGITQHFLAVSDPAGKTIWREWKAGSWQKILSRDVPNDVVEEYNTPT